MSLALALPWDMLARWQGIVDLLAQTMEVPAALITRVDPPMVEVLLANRHPDNPYQAGDKVAMARHYCEWVVREKKMLLLPNALESPDWSQAPEVGYGVISYLGLPLSWPDGSVFGTICVLDRKSNPFSRRFESLLDYLRDLVESHLALLVRNRDLAMRNQELQRALDDVRTMRRLLPICAHCKKIRDSEGAWHEVERYLAQRGQADFTHSICPECARIHFPDLLD